MRLALRRQRVLQPLRQGRPSLQPQERVQSLEASTPVSYTHLDVYKRQAYEAEQRGLLGDLEQMPYHAVQDLDAVTMVDLAISPKGEPVLDVERIAEILTRYEEDDAVYQAVKASTPHLLRSSSQAKARLGLPQDWPICG